MSRNSTASENTLAMRENPPASDIERGEANIIGSEMEKKGKVSDIVSWDGNDDIANPQNWSKNKKIGVTLLYGANTMCATFASSIFSAAAPFIAKQYGISTVVSILGLSLYLLGFVVGPIIFAPVSDVWGRKISLIPPMFVFVCFSAATATAENLQAIFITRFFAGVFSSAPVTVVGGGIADMWNQRERGSAIVIYSLCIVGGPTVAPVIGAAVSQSYLTWRWTEYLVVILTSFILVLDLFFLPETSGNVILTKKARKMRFESGNWALHSKHEESDHSLKVFLNKNLKLPVKMLLMEPMCTLITTYNAFAYGVLYLLFASIPIIFEENRGWSTVPGSLPNLATLVGTLLAATVNYFYSEKFFAKYLDQHGGKAPPEKRLPPMMLGSILFPIGFFIIGWTSKPSIHWFPSLIGFVLIGMSFLLIFQAGLNYLIDAYTKNAASAVAANTFNRSIFAAALPLVAQPLFHNLGIDWACTLLGLIAVLLGVTPYLFYNYGERIRAKSTLIKNL
ncbi:uncharacterized protein I206_100958 [Kwoniella pini CBS 10737]|uniref:Major facilitator superfamily (MFS) profile domain-containing protein n=1 Tax=Kwoniella pini CBS 10737 TaxID=1296096 RepID=A0AAJ8MKQ9_9TREE